MNPAFIKMNNIYFPLSGDQHTLQGD